MSLQILINELSLLPFNKHNCVAMLNTLYPPVVSTPPTTKLTPSILKGQRDGFFKYIQSVERGGPRILYNLMQQGKRHGDDNGWPAACSTMNMYLQVANSIIAECSEIADVADISPKKADPKARKGRKIDSSVSLGGSEGRPSTGGSVDEPPSPIDNRPKTPSSSRNGTTLEKIARGLRTIGRGRTDATEMVHQEPEAPEKPKALRKMRSMGNISSNNASKTSLGSNGKPAPIFNIEEMRRQRQQYDAKVGLSHEI